MRHADTHQAKTGTRRPTPDTRLLIPALVLLGLTLLVFAPFLWHTVQKGSSAWGIHDWAQFYAWYDLPRVALIEHGELAFWNPYVSGGIPGFGHTHDPTFSPVFLVIVLLGPVTGARVLMVAWVYGAMLSAFALARALRLGRIGCYLAAVVWGLNGNLMLHLTAGHLMHMGVGLLPLAMLLFLGNRGKSGDGMPGLRVQDDANRPMLSPDFRGCGHRTTPTVLCGPPISRDVVLLGLLLGGLVLSGSIYPAAFAGMLLVVWAVWLAIFGGSFRWLSRLVQVGVFAVLFAAVKLVCVLPFLQRIQQAKEDTSATGLGFLWRRMVDPTPPWEVHQLGHYTLGYWEFGAYVGLPVVVLAAVGLLLAALKAASVVFGWRVPGIGGEEQDSARPTPRTPFLGAFLITAAIFLLLSLGAKGLVDLFGLLRKAPMLSGMHVPFRFTIVPLLAVALLGGLGADWLARRGRRARAAAVVLLVAVAADLGLAYQHLIPRAFALDAIDVEAGTAAAIHPSLLPGRKGQSGSLVVADVGARGPHLFEQRLVAYTAASMPGMTAVSDPWRIEVGRVEAQGAAIHVLTVRDLYVVEPHAAARYLMQLQRRGNPEAYEMLRLPTAVRWAGGPDYRGEAFLAGGRGTAQLVAFSPSRFTVEVEADSPDILVLNQNMYPGWHVSMDGEHQRVAGGRALVAAPVPAGMRRVVFWYRPDGFRAGLAVTIGSLVAAVILVAVARRRPKAAEEMAP